MTDKPPTPVLSERCSCNALFEVGPNVDWRTALVAAEDWRVKHKHSVPFPARPDTDDRGSASTSTANCWEQPTVGFRGLGTWES